MSFDSSRNSLSDKTPKNKIKSTKIPKNRKKMFLNSNLKWLTNYIRLMNIIIYMQQQQKKSSLNSLSIRTFLNSLRVICNKKFNNNLYNKLVIFLKS